MSTPTTPPPAARALLDVSGTPRTPFARLVSVELRKMADTRAGVWLLSAIVLVTAAIMVIFLFAAPEEERTFVNFMGISAVPQGFLLPVLAILLVTSEWSQRTALVTFSLVPKRVTVLVAKVLAALVIGLAAFVIVSLVAAVATTLGGADNAWEGIGWDSFAKFGLLQGFGILQGLAFGLALLSSPAAIVLFFVLPTVFSVISSVWSAMADVQPWVDFSYSQEPLFSSVDMTGEQWAHLLTGFLIWVALPFALGVVRLLRSEVK